MMEGDGGGVHWLCFAWEEVDPNREGCSDLGVAPWEGSGGGSQDEESTGCCCYHLNALGICPGLTLLSPAQKSPHGPEPCLQPLLKEILP